MRLAKPFRFWGLAISGVAAILPGCSSLPVQDSGSRGLLQSPVAATREPKEVSIALPPRVSQSSESGFSWPIRSGKLSSLFGARRRDFHEGIDVSAPIGTPVYAAKAGVVIYSSRRIRGYGNMIVVRHDSHWASVYAHHRNNVAKVGTRVQQGQLIGYVGRTGSKATGPHLHFEIRRGELPHDPLLYLPEVRASSVAKAGAESDEDESDSGAADGS